MRGTAEKNGRTQKRCCSIHMVTPVLTDQQKLIWEVSVRTAAVLLDVVARICSKQHPCVVLIIFYPETL